MSNRPAQQDPIPEPVYRVSLLPEVREAMEAYAREHKIPVNVAIAEACRSFAGIAE